MDFNEIAIECERMTLVNHGKKETVFYEDANNTSEYVSSFNLQKTEQEPIQQI